MSTKTYAEYSTEELRFLTQGIMTYLDAWEMTNEQILIVLGLNNEVKTRKLQAYRNGSEVFPDFSDLMARVDHIIGIADALRTQFPFSEQMRLMWLRKPHRRFQRNQPLKVMLDNESANGLLKVRMEVDCNYAYAISEAMRDQQQS